MSCADPNKNHVVKITVGSALVTHRILEASSPDEALAKAISYWPWWEGSILNSAISSFLTEQKSSTDYI